MIMLMAPAPEAISIPKNKILVQQSRNVTGTVRSLEGETLPGVSIVLKGTSTGTVTDVEGKFSLSVPSDDATLVFSSIGYVTQEIGVNGRSVIDITLGEDVQSLEEVVVIGYGTQKKATLTGSVTSVAPEKLQFR